MCLNHPEQVHCTKLSLSTSLQRKQGVQGAYPQVRGGSTVPKFLCLHRYRRNKECRVLMHKFGMVQAHRTSSILLEPHHYRDSKMYRVLLHKIGVVRGSSSAIMCFEKVRGGLMHLKVRYSRTTPKKNSTHLAM